MANGQPHVGIRGCGGGCCGGGCGGGRGFFGGGFWGGPFWGAGFFAPPVFGPFGVPPIGLYGAPGPYFGRGVLGGFNGGALVDRSFGLSPIPPLL